MTENHGVGSSILPLATTPNVNRVSSAAQPEPVLVICAEGTYADASLRARMGRRLPMRLTLGQISVVLSVVCAIAIAVTITAAASRPAATSNMSAQPAAVDAPTNPGSDFIAAAARSTVCPPCDFKDGEPTKFLVKHCDGRDATGCVSFQILCLPLPAVYAHLEDDGSPTAGHEDDTCGPSPD